ncbi:hypothetical protein A8709_05280 [Paenibacillus pectinilyticus]|uniref:NAD(P)-binding domain-containing protein n=1 Tax=Paenibacillus pectinilyticus TaxID=512399 RepID=A0A1C0ZSP9_9BACL|nr:hypothetical protein [Paenibacillus pectinilyticus]OCT11105.1 hypothetical protein A8709_05280 [Paenibacillus pectinilyticus]
MGGFLYTIQNRIVCWGEMVQILEKELGLPAHLNKQPSQPGDVPQTYADVSKAHRLLGYMPRTPFEEGIKKFMNWHRGEGHDEAINCSTDL